MTINANLNNSLGDDLWLYTSIYGMPGSAVKVYANAVFCLPKVLEELGYSFEILNMSPDCEFQIDHQTPEQELDGTWTLYPVDLDPFKFYNDDLEITHPWIRDIPKGKRRKMANQLFPRAEYNINIPEHKMLVACSGSRIRFITEVASFPVISRICKHIGTYVYHEPCVPTPPVPRVKLIERANDGTFYSRDFSLPYNPVTDAMLHTGYSVTVGKEKQFEQDGLQLMGSIVKSVSYKRRNLGATVFPGKGLYILHGSPGTGKSKFITQLLVALEAEGLNNRDIFYFPPQAISLLGTPEFMSWLVRQEGAIIIAEDAESVLQASEIRTPATSNILNLTDGLFGDLLQVTFIATFNCPVNDIDPALLRPGRLKLLANFNRLTDDQANLAHDTILSEKFGVTCEELPYSLPSSKNGYSLAEIYQAMEVLTPLTDISKDDDVDD